MNPIRLSLLAAAVGLAACATKSPLEPIKPGVVQTIPAGDWHPLAAGMSWTYTVTDVGATVGTMTMTVAEAKKSGSQTNATGFRQLDLKLASNATEHHSVTPVTWTKTRDSLTEAVDGEDAREIVDMQPKVGTQWTMDGFDMVVMGMNDVPVGGKTWKNALRVQAVQGDTLGAAYFVRDTGMIALSLRKFPAYGNRYVALALQAFVKKDAPIPTPVPSGTATPGASPSVDVTPSPSPSPTASPTPSPTPTSP